MRKSTKIALILFTAIIFAFVGLFLESYYSHIAKLKALEPTPEEKTAFNLIVNQCKSFCNNPYREYNSCLNTCIYGNELDDAIECIYGDDIFDDGKPCPSSSIPPPPTLP